MLSILVSATLHFSLRQGDQLVPMLLCMVVFGWAGFLIGLWADFGDLGLVALRDLCIPTRGFEWPLWSAKLEMAPLTYFGMFLGCNAGMWIVGRSTGMSREKGLYTLLQIVVVNIGMWGGMVGAESVSFPFIGNKVIDPLVASVVKMFLGMTLGMILASHLFKWVSSLFRGYGLGLPRMHQ